MQIDPDLTDFAVDLTRRAGRLAAEHFYAADLGTSRKPDGSEVTAADLAVEEFVRQELAAYAPQDGILGEEHGESAGASGRRWVVDPISGTSYLTRRMPLFANLLAVEDEHGPAIGVINMPIQRETVFAVRGGGCFLIQGDDAPQRLRLPERSKLDGALVLAANQHAWSPQLLLALHERVNLVGGIHHAVVHLVTGRVDAVVLTHLGYDDLAPLPVILAEAGGVVTDLSGAPVLAGAGSALAASPALHAELLALTEPLPHVRGPKGI